MRKSTARPQPSSIIVISYVCVIVCVFVYGGTPMTSEHRVSHDVCAHLFMLMHVYVSQRTIVRCSRARSSTSTSLCVCLLLGCEWVSRETSAMRMQYAELAGCSMWSNIRLLCVCATIPSCLDMVCRVTGPIAWPDKPDIVCTDRYSYLPINNCRLQYTIRWWGIGRGGNNVDISSTDACACHCNASKRSLTCDDMSSKWGCVLWACDDTFGSNVGILVCWSMSIEELTSTQDIQAMMNVDWIWHNMNTGNCVYIFAYAMGLYKRSHSLSVCRNYE